MCDEPVEPNRSVNDARGPSVDSYYTAGKAAKGRGGVERLAHRACNTKKGATTPVITWSRDLLVADPAVLLTTTERLQRKGGREIVARCPSNNDAQKTSAWLKDRLTRLAPALPVAVTVEPGGSQYVVVLTTPRR